MSHQIPTVYMYYYWFWKVVNFLSVFLVRRFFYKVFYIPTSWAVKADVLYRSEMLAAETDLHWSTWRRLIYSCNIKSFSYTEPLRDDRVYVTVQTLQNAHGATNFFLTMSFTISFSKGSKWITSCERLSKQILKIDEIISSRN